jgi:hypothetical protein
MTAPKPAQPAFTPPAEPADPPDGDGTDDTQPGDGGTGAEGAADKPGDDADPEGADALEDPGKKALDSMKARLKRERERRIAAEADLAEARKPKPKPKPPPKPAADAATPEADPAPDAEEIRRQVEAELNEKHARAQVLTTIEAKAARGFADPADAVALVMRGHKPDDFLDKGEPDVEAIQEALTELLEQKPYLAAVPAQGGKPTRFQGSADAGAKPTKPARPKSLDEAVRRSLAPH